VRKKEKKELKVSYIEEPSKSDEESPRLFNSASAENVGIPNTFDVKKLLKDYDTLKRQRKKDEMVISQLELEKEKLQAEVFRLKAVIENMTGTKSDSEKIEDDFKHRKISAPASIENTPRNRAMATVAETHEGDKSLTNSREPELHISSDNVSEERKKAKHRVKSIASKIRNKDQKKKHRRKSTETTRLMINVSEVTVTLPTVKSTPIIDPITSININPSFIPSDLLPYIQSEIPYKPYKHPVFGSPISHLVLSDEPHYFFKVLLNFLSSPSALSSVGIFRVSGSKEEIMHYKQLFDEGKPVQFKCSAFEVAGLMKEFLRSLREPLIPAFWNSQIPLLLDQYRHSDKQNYQQFLSDLKLVVATLPKPNYAIFRILVIILAQVVSNAEQNMMTVDNIIKCVAPNLSCYPALFTHSIPNAKFFFEEPLNNQKKAANRRSSFFRSIFNSRHCFSS